MVVLLWIEIGTGGSQKTMLELPGTGLPDAKRFRVES
jgi:hypothetical protein